MNIFIDHVGDGHKYYRMAIISIPYNVCLRRRCLTKKGNVAQVEFYNNRFKSMTLIRERERERERERDKARGRERQRERERERGGGGGGGDDSVFP